MVSKTVEHVFQIFLLIIGVLIGISFLFQFLDLVGKASGLVTNTTEEPEEVIESIPRRPLEINDKDSPDVMIYKLLKNFDPLFLNETFNDKILYNSFTLELKGNTYGDGTTGHASVFIDKIRSGLVDFSSVDEFYQIGNPLPPDCGAVESNSNIDFYTNDCWDPSIDVEPSPCKIYVNAYTSHSFNFHEFRNRVKIRVVWYKTSSTVGDKEIIHTTVAVCNDNAMSI